MTRRKFSSKFKTKVVLEALKERMSMSELARKFELQPQQIVQCMPTATKSELYNLKISIDFHYEKDQRN